MPKDREGKLRNAPKFGEKINSGDTPYKVEEIHYKEEKKRDGSVKAPPTRKGK